MSDSAERHVPAGFPAEAVPRTAQRIGFRRHLRAEVVAGEATYLFSERGVTALTCPLVAALAPLLDGTRDLPTVLRELPDGPTSEEVGGIVDQLIDAGLVRLWSQAPSGASGAATTQITPEAEAYWDATGLDPLSAVARIASARLSLRAAGDLGSATTEAARGALAAAGLRVAAGPLEPADLSVVLCTDYLSPELARIDAAHRAEGRPWLLARPVGATVWVGPVFQPGHGCWQCLAVRLRAHRQAESHVQAALGRSGPAARSAVSVSPLSAMAMHLIALEAVKWLAGHRYHGQHCVWTFDSFGLRGRHHELRARPQCAGCGDPSLVSRRARRPVVLRSRRRLSRGRGTTDGHRSQPPEQVLDTYRHLVSPVTGVIKEIGRDRRGPSFFNSFRSGPSIATAGCPHTLRGLLSAQRVGNSGKGTTPLHAEVSALCEALERHCASFQGDEERTRGSLHSLGERAIHPNTCQLYAERQYESRETWNTRHAPFQYVCAPFDESAELDWTPVWSLTDGRHRLLPTAMLYFGAPTQGPRTAGADSNGNAAGSSMADAVLQGLLELVERDAVALWWYNRTHAPAVDLDAFGDPWLAELRQVHAELGRDVWVLDVTSDLRVPTMVALSRRPNSRHERIVLGFGAHPDPLVALRHALTELNQMMPVVIDAGVDGDFVVDGDPDATRWFRHATVANQPYLVPDPSVRPRRPADHEYRPRTDAAAEVRALQRRLEELGMQVLVLDQTRPDIGLPVVKVIVPGLRPFWARFAPGRLFDVPVRLGRLTEPTRYEDLNPIPLFV